MRFNDPQRLYFFLDFVSHNAWLAWHQIGALVERHGLVLEPVPVVFGAMLKAHEQLGPAEVPPKRDWMIRNVLRKARLGGIPIAPPASHPFSSLLALRLVCCELSPTARVDLCTRLFRAAWAESRPLQDPATLTAILQEAGLDAAALLAQAQAGPAKSRLRDHTESALAAGIFGVPAMRVRGADFWGYDDFEHLERHLRGEEPVVDADLDPWRRVRPSVERRR